MPTNRKKSVRARMSKTGESWQTAARHVDGSPPPRIASEDESTQMLARAIDAQRGHTVQMLSRDVVEKVIERHRRLGREVTPIYELPGDPGGWSHGVPLLADGSRDPGPGTLVGYETKYPDAPDARTTTTYKFAGTGAGYGKIDEDDHDDLFVMLDDIVAYIREKGDTVYCADDPLNDRIGFMVERPVEGGVEGEVTLKHWRLHVRKLAASLRNHPDQTRVTLIRNWLQTHAGRIRLAASIPGQKATATALWGEAQIDRTPLPTDWEDIHELWADMERFGKDHPDHVVLSADDPGVNYDPPRAGRLGWTAFRPPPITPEGTPYRTDHDEQAKMWTITLDNLRRTLRRTEDPRADKLTTAKGRAEIAEGFTGKKYVP